MLGPTPFRDICLVAGFELREMLRSRRAVFVIALYLLVAALFTYGFVQVLERVNEVAKNPAALVTGSNPSANGPGGRGRNRGPVFAPSPADKPSQGILVTPNSPFSRLIFSGVQDPATKDFLVRQPPIVLFYTLASLFFTPLLILLTTSETIAQEHQSRGARFIVLRTGKLEFALGKLAGQGLLMALVTLLAGGMCLVIASWKLSDFELGPAISSTLIFWPRIVAYGLPFLGLAALCSMNSSAAIAARGFAVFGLGTLFYLHYLAGLATDQSVLTNVLGALDYLTPFSHWADLWNASAAQVWNAMMLLAGLGVLYTGIGLVFYRRRDL